MLKIFDKTVWIWSHLDALMPWNGLSVIVVGRNTAERPADSPLALEQHRFQRAPDTPKSV